MPLERWALTLSHFQKDLWCEVWNHGGLATRCLWNQAAGFVILLLSTDADGRKKINCVILAALLAIWTTAGFRISNVSTCKYYKNASCVSDIFLIFSDAQNSSQVIFNTSHGCTFLKALCSDWPFFCMTLQVDVIVPPTYFVEWTITFWLISLIPPGHHPIVYFIPLLWLLCVSEISKIVDLDCEIPPRSFLARLKSPPLLKTCCRWVNKPNVSAFCPLSWIDSTRETCWSLDLIGS